METAYFKHLLGVLRSKRWLVAAVALTVVALVILQLYTTTPTYRSTALIQIDSRSAKILPYEDVTDSTRSSPFATREDIQTQSTKLRARGLAARVIGELDLGGDESFNARTHRGAILDLTGKVKSLPRMLLRRGSGGGSLDAEAGRQVLIDRFLGHLDVMPVRNTRLISVSYRSHDPQLAATVVNTIADQFIQQHLETKYETTAMAKEFLEGQLDEMVKEVEASELGLLEYARENNIVNLSERESIARNDLSELSNDVTTAYSEMISAKARYDARPSATPDRFPAVLANDTIRQLESELSASERELSALSNRFGDDWPAARKLAATINKIEQQLTAERTKAVGTARSEYLLASDRHEKLQAALNSQRVVVDRLNQDSIQYNIMRRTVETNKELYEGLLQRLKEAGVAGGLRASNISVADYGVVSRGPFEPRKARGAVLGLILGLFLGVGAALLSDSLDNTIKDAQDVTDRIGLPTLGMVPLLRADLAAAKATTSKGNNPLVVFSESRQFQARDWEAYRSLRTSILLSHSDKPPQTMLVTSCLPGEGKSTTAVNTAIALAQTGAKTALIDLDLRKPSLGPIFGIDDPQGMSTYLSGISDLGTHLHPTSFPNLHVLPSGPLAPNPAELIGSGRMAAGLEELKRDFECIVIDSPPSLEFTDALVLSPRVDGVILVARSGKTPRDALRRVTDRLFDVGATVLGVLINGLERGSSTDGYYDYYEGYYAAAQSAAEPKETGTSSS